MFALYDDQRQALIRVGFMISVGATAVLPFTLTPSSLIAGADPVRASVASTVPQVPERMAYPSIVMSRDPFAPDEAVVIRDGTANDPERSTSVSGDPSLPPTVRAVVTGDQARALIDNNGSVQVLGVGDHLGSETITAIEAGGVTLSSGIRLLLVSPR